MKKIDPSVIHFLTDQILEASVRKDAEFIEMHYTLADLYSRGLVNAHWNEDKTDLGFSFNDDNAVNLPVLSQIFSNSPDIAEA